MAETIQHYILHGSSKNSEKYHVANTLCRIYFFLLKRFPKNPHLFLLFFFKKDAWHDDHIPPSSRYPKPKFEKLAGRPSNDLTGWLVGWLAGGFSPTKWGKICNRQIGFICRNFRDENSKHIWVATTQMMVGGFDDSLNLLSPKNEFVKIFGGGYNPWKLTWLTGKSQLSNRKYIFIPGGLSSQSLFSFQWSI